MMEKYCTVREISEKWKLSERSVRDYCARGKIPGATLAGKIWRIPANAEKPGRANASEKKTCVSQLLERLRFERKRGMKGGIYHKLQVELTFNSNHMEGSRLTEEETGLIFETNSILASPEKAHSVDDIVETANHFRCVDYVIDNADRKLNVHFIKHLHALLKNGTADSAQPWFAVGNWKKIANEIGMQETAAPEDVPRLMDELLTEYHALPAVTLDDVLAFHVRFEQIHPFQDGNGRIGRLIMLKECLKNGITPFIIDDRNKIFYYLGLREWDTAPVRLRELALMQQDDFRAYMNYFGIRNSGK